MSVKQSTVPGMQDQIFHNLFSALAIKQNGRNELPFFQKTDNEFTNMKAQNSLPKHEVFWLKGITIDIYNVDGSAINWTGKTEGLRKFINQAVLELHIGSKVYIDKLPLRNLYKVPEVATTANAVAISEAGNPSNLEKAMFKLPQAITLEGGMDFHIQVIGNAGAYDAAAGFSDQTRLQINLHGMLGRPVQ